MSDKHPTPWKLEETDVDTTISVVDSKGETVLQLHDLLDDELAVFPRIVAAVNGMEAASVLDWSFMDDRGMSDILSDYGKATARAATCVKCKRCDEPVPSQYLGKRGYCPPCMEQLCDSLQSDIEESEADDEKA